MHVEAKVDGSSITSKHLSLTILRRDIHVAKVSDAILKTYFFFLLISSKNTRHKRLEVIYVEGKIFFGGEPRLMLVS